MNSPNHSEHNFLEGFKGGLVNCRAQSCTARTCLALSFLLIVGLLCGPQNSQAQSDSKPNIILIYIDDLGWQDVGYMGNQFICTPHVDSLAAEGRMFTNAYANAPNCAPSRAALMSGQYAPRTGVYTVGRSNRGPVHLQKVIPPPNKKQLDDEVITIAEVLKMVGYTCASIGKWHLGNDPTAQGFDINIAGSRKGQPDSYFSPYRIPNLEDGPRSEYLTDRLTDEAIGFIRAHRDTSFFLYLPHFAVHTPISVRPDALKSYRKRFPEANARTISYAAMVEATDESVGRIVREIDEMNLTQETLIIFYSDNGGHHGYSTLGPLRGGKGEVYEGGIRTPMIIRRPGVVAPGVSDIPVIGIDLFPTIAALAGADTKELLLDGHVLQLDQVGGEAPADRAIFWHFPVYLDAYAESVGIFRAKPCSVIRRGRYKLIQSLETGGLQLFDLEVDLSETNNLRNQMPELADSLLTELQAWQAATNAPIPTEPNPEYKSK